MQIYLVGGAVRDKILGYPSSEKDWVVIGSSPDEMQSQGFIQVGKDFPVYLHPKTKEEYALARTERKSGTGYYGFQCDFSPGVTLEEDLLRRDLTINAIAENQDGQIIDPFHGLDDLNDKILRHISPAFVEDPVRVLRVARFAARYAHLGFKIAKETLLLMYSMVKKGELNYLIPERVWQEWFKSLTEKNPESFISTLRSCDALKIILPEINQLYGVPNPVDYHPEIDTGIHSMMALQASVQLTSDPDVRFATLLHDIGKGFTPMTEWPKHYQHDEKGLIPIQKLCERLRIPSDFKALALLVCKEHLNIARLFELKATTIVKIMERCDAFRRPDRFVKLLIACEADARGRPEAIKKYPQRNLWVKLLESCMNIEVEDFIEKGLQGEKIKHAIHEQRVPIVKSQWEIIGKEVKDNNNLIWIDLEMTGLEVEQDRIIEIATVVTDSHLAILAEGPVFAIHQDEVRMNNMDEWNTKQHQSSGLVKRVLESNITEKEAEQKTLTFLKKYIDTGKSPMCGNSICQDRRFLYKYMPDLANFFHYRNLDVSTLKELAKRWRPKLFAGLTKDSKHLALDDIKDSIEELQYYRQHFINLTETL